MRKFAINKKNALLIITIFFFIISFGVRTHAATTSIGEFINVDNVSLEVYDSNDNLYEFTYNRLQLYEMGALTNNYYTLQIDVIIEYISTYLINVYQVDFDYVNQYIITFDKAIALDDDLYLEVDMFETSITTYSVIFNGYGPNYEEITWYSIEGGGDVQYIFEENIYQNALNGGFFETISSYEYNTLSQMVYKYTFKRISNDSLIDTITNLQNQISNLENIITSLEISNTSLLNQLEILRLQYNNLDENYQQLLNGSVSLPNLILTYIEIPYKALFGFLNFEIFGTNLYTALSGIITMLLVLWVISKVK